MHIHDPMFCGFNLPWTSHMTPDIVFMWNTTETSFGRDFDRVKVREIFSPNFTLFITRASPLNFPNSWVDSFWDLTDAEACADFSCDFLWRIHRDNFNVILWKSHDRHFKQMFLTVANISLHFYSHILMRVYARWKIIEIDSVCTHTTLKIIFIFGFLDFDEATPF